MSPYIGIIIQARLTSSRFPNKILADLFGRPVLEHVVERCQMSELADEVVIAAPHQLGVCLNEKLFIGSEDDVLDRYYQCAKHYGFDLVVRITSDCPLIMPSEIDRCIERIIQRDTQYVTNCPAMQDGFDVEVFHFKALEKAWRESTLQSDREHVTPYMKRDESINPISLPALKLSIDTAEDLDRIKQYVRWQADSNNRWHGQLCSELPKTYSSVQQA